MEGQGHAEETIINALGDNWAIVAGGTSRGLCKETCAPLVLGHSLTIGGPEHRAQSHNTPYEMFWLGYS